MKRIRLTRDEKRLLRILGSGDKGNGLALSESARYLAARSLERKGLVDAAFSYGEIVDIRPSYEGRAYLICNPSLRNPVNWALILQIATFIASVLALLIGCTLISCAATS